MTRRALLLLLALAAGAAPAEEASVSATVVATRPLRAQSVLTASDLSLEPGATPGAVTRIEDAVGLETRRGLYPGRPVMAGDLAPPALVERNAMVLLRYRDGGLTIETDGRALGRGGIGERVRVMNIDSRNAVTGVVVAPNTVEVR
jgi:flagella basal body P-ring formation protein FlgA